MSKRFLHWFARAAGNKGHIAFSEARRLYMSYIDTLTKPFDQLGNDDFVAAKSSSDLARAEHFYTEAREHATHEGRSDNVATVDYQVGMLFHLQGRLKEARFRLKSSVDTFQSRVTTDRSERSMLSGCYYHLGIIAMREGNRMEAERLLHKSLAIDTADMDIAGMRMCKEALSTVASQPFFSSNSIGQSPGINEEDNISGDSGANPIYPTQPIPFDTRLSQPNPTVDSLNGASIEAKAILGKERSDTAGSHDYPGAKSGRNNVVWILSHSVEANDLYWTEVMRQFSNKIPDKFTIQRAAMGSQDSTRATLKPILPGERLCAVVLILEKEGLANTEYMRLAKICVNRVSTADDFRLFVGATEAGHQIDEYEEYCKFEGRQLIDEIAQTVQLITADDEDIFPSNSTGSDIITPIFIPGPQEVLKACLAYLKDVDAIRSAAILRNLRLRFSIFIGRVALWSQIAAFLNLSFIAAAITTLGREAALSKLISSHHEIVGLLAGIVLFPINTFPAFFIFRGPRAVQAFMQNRTAYKGLFMTLIFISLGLTFLSSHLAVPTPWLLLGISAGAVFDYARRYGIYARRSTISLQACLESTSNAEQLDQIIAQGVKATEHPLNMPLFPAVRPRIFISYARRTSWSARMARQLHRLLNAQRALSFFDREAIGVGSSWRMVLNRCIADADVFISFVEAKTTARRWVAAEIIAALSAKAISGSPRVVVLTAADMDTWPAHKCLPVFNAIVRNSPPISDESRVRVIKADEASLASVASSLRPAHYQTASVLPDTWSLILQGITIPLVSIGSLGEILGYPAAILFILEYWNKTSVGHFLSEWRLLEVACLIGCYLTGFSARLVASTTWEVRRENDRRPTKAISISFGGLAALSILWLNRVDPLIIGWSVVLGCVGWYLSGLFLQTVKRVKPELFGPD